MWIKRGRSENFVSFQVVWILGVLRFFFFFFLIVTSFCIDDVIEIADSHLTRKVPASYSDGVYMMGGLNRPNPRKLSEMFMKGPDGLGSIMNRTVLFAFFGEYLRLCKRASFICVTLDGHNVTALTELGKYAASQHC